MKRYGGFKGVALNQVAEAECYVVPPYEVSWWELIKATIITAIKIIPFVIAFGAIAWGLSFVLLNLLGVQPIS